MTDCVSVEIRRFTTYDGTKGNAVAFADVEVHADGGVYRFPDVKLYRKGRAGLSISPKQVRTDRGIWGFAYHIPPEFYEAIRREMIRRWEVERRGQLALV